jgi:hypothetical protein
MIGRGTVYEFLYGLCVFGNSSDIRDLKKEQGSLKKELANYWFHMEVRNRVCP